MFCVIYRFTVREGRDAEFREVWHGLTQLIHEHQGSLGSRLHTTETSNVYMAYAQWPSRDLWAAPPPLPEPGKALKDRLKACTSGIEVLDELEVADDLLEPARPGK